MSSAKRPVRKKAKKKTAGGTARKKTTKKKATGKKSTGKKVAAKKTPSKKKAVRKKTKKKTTTRVAAKKAGGKKATTKKAKRKAPIGAARKTTSKPIGAVKHFGASAGTVIDPESRGGETTTNGTSASQPGWLDRFKGLVRRLYDE